MLKVVTAEILPLRKCSLRHKPGMYVERETTRLYRRIGCRQRACFLQRVDPEHKDPSQVSAVPERSGNYKFLLGCKPLDICYVCLLQFNDCRSLFGTPFRTARKETRICRARFL